ncbi:alpha/beta fold hydrolase [Fulvimonas sp. R45]|uniref:alpha/beta hydrolase family protein n=1 Tax=Fulvimonas sp. R45 TaxID=3045937 RepID=UPI00265FB28D|nr:alpha/beta fold hydrolase [Fulvimonas sp. R45]MDO1529923.1 alpha/beta fold hydrolase [Fulvimonas sp. R45]
MTHRLPSGFRAACLAMAIALGTCLPQGAAATAQAAAARASMQVMQIPSHGERLNAIAYVAAGAGPHPTVVLLHGFPGYERNLDLAQDMRRAGWDVVYFDYRGSWGTPGAFSFGHAIEDAASVLAYLHRPDVAKTLRLDPARIVPVGHSMGGFIAVQAAAADPAIKAFALISGADMGGLFRQVRDAQGLPAALKVASANLSGAGLAPLHGCSPDGLARELADHASDWPFPARVDALKDRAAFVVMADDPFAATDDAFAAALRKAGDARVDTLHLATDHVYSDHRIELSQALLRWLASLPK